MNINHIMTKIFLVSLFLLLILSLSSCNNYVFLTLNYDGYLDTSNYIIVEYDNSHNSKNKLQEEINNIVIPILELIETEASPSSSTVSLINENAGKKGINVSDTFLYLLNENIKYAKLFPNFDPTIGALTSIWDISHQAEYCLINNNCNIPSIDDINDAKSKVNYQNIIIDGNNVYLKEENMKLDLGASAKGYAADLIKEALIKANFDFFVINLGGNIYIHGESINYNKNNKDVEIALEDPFDASSKLLDVIIYDKTIVTSSITKRYIIKDDIKYHHILDKITGYPVNNDMVQVSIILDNSLQADIFSTAIISMENAERAKEYMIKNNIDGIIVTSSYDIYIIGDINYNDLNNGVYNILIYKNE